MGAQKSKVGKAMTHIIRKTGEESLGDKIARAREGQQGVKLQVRGGLEMLLNEHSARGINVNAKLTILLAHDIVVKGATLERKVLAVDLAPKIYISELIRGDQNAAGLTVDADDELDVHVFLPIVKRL